ncbi:MAG TPA: P-II family nitrogen regulator [Terriglobales bacterium]|nr:P-II family nitrogen regulator [Terriglobales bacterium]
MKEIKAYIRREIVPKVVDGLQTAGAPGISLIEIHPVGYGFEPNYFAEHFENVEKRYSYLRIVKVEVVCADRDVERLTGIIQQTAHTGAPGDGIIFIAEVVNAVRIRNGTCGERALNCSGEPILGEL